MKKCRVVIVLPGEAREVRLEGARTGRNPKEFFYGGLALQEMGHDVVFLNARQLAGGLVGRFRQYCERKINGLTQIGITRSQVELITPHLDGADMLIGFTDSISLSMGYYRHLLPQKLKVVGGFHGLADWRMRVRTPFRRVFDELVRSSIRRLDYAMTSGSADRDVAVRQYSLSPSLLESYDFGVDQSFWCPANNSTAKDGGERFFLAIGSDPQRDYGVIARAQLPAKVKVITKLDEQGLQQNPEVEFLRGSLAKSNFSDENIRDLYRACRGVIVPIKNVWQPSGCSVTLQAMSCGKPVILTDYKGLFDRDLLRDGENCLLMPPDNPLALAQALNRLSNDDALHARLSEGALKTAQQYFGLRRLEGTVAALVDRLGASG
ncbi:glycosyltransferase family 4 protein [Thalassospira tepidiphila]|uniref:glycosyltransferase family 4 protein n=1 Tax=Thalassospira tepidiphila TaxID=393657 RepID=UPI0030C71D8D